jgi:hypothetical protein
LDAFRTRLIANPASVWTMAEELFAIKGDPLAAVFVAVSPEPLLLRHHAQICAWSRSIGDCQQDMLFVLQ